MWVKIIIALVFVGIIASLASGLYYMVNDKGDSRRTLRALTYRIGLSIGLFVFVMILIGLDVIEPHGVHRGSPSAAMPDASPPDAPR